MTIAQMTYIVALSEDLNISHAAERLYITPSALSQSLAKIGTELGYSIFLRSSNPFIITPEGRQFIDCCQKILDLYEHSKISIESNLRSRRKQITLGMSTERTSLLLSQCYSGFKQSFPDYTLIQEEGFASTHAALVEEGLIDLALTPLLPSFNTVVRSSLQYEHIGFEELVLYCSKDSSLSQYYQETLTPLPWDMLTNQYFIHQGKNKYTRQIIDYYLENKNIYPTTVMELNNTDICIQFAEVGSGITIAPKFFAHKHPDAEQVPMEDPIIWSVNLLYRKSKHFSPPEKYLCQCLKDLYGTA